MQLSWAMTPIYAGYGGALNLSVVSQSPNQIYIYGFGVEWPDHGLETSRTCSVNLTSGGKVNLGLLFFTAPEEAGREDYRIFVERMVHAPDGTGWNDTIMYTGLWDTEVLGPIGPAVYDVSLNPRNYYDKATALMDGDAVSALVKQAQAQVPGPYSLQQLLYVFDWVRENIEYTADPSDEWQSSMDTLALRGGDCEDHAILVATIVRELGGCARFNLIDGHAFATVFIGDKYTDLTAIRMAISSHYGTLLPVHYLLDDSGYWMTMDTVGFPYAGGLTASSAPVVDGDVDWTFEGTDILIKVDAVQDQ
jgi:transglutaminase-like putative cysteine protease